MDKYHIPPVLVFENYELVEVSNGRVVIETRVVDSSLNIYGMTHGGYLFTFCDNVAGLAVFSQGYKCVTLQSNVHFTRAGHLGDKLTITAEIVHDGRSTKLVEAVVTNEKGQKLVRASFTMFVTGSFEEES
ncbi:PaaI family thioesterase [Streptococcus suis]